MEMTVAHIDQKVADLVPTQKERDFELSQREAKALAASELMPEAFRGNIPNTLIAINLARRIGADPLAVAQSMYIVHGKPSLSSSFLIGCFNSSGRFTPIRYRIIGEGKTLECTATTTDRETGELIEGPTVTMDMARAEGWTDKKGSKWITMPSLMIRYRAAAFLIRTTAPEIAFGLHTIDELDDIRTDRKSGASAARATDALAGARDVTPPLEPEYESQEPEIDPADAAFGLTGGD
jgi:hypothetical protein